MKIKNGNTAFYASRAREELGDMDKPGKNTRPAGMVDSPTPRLLDSH